MQLGILPTIPEPKRSKLLFTLITYSHIHSNDMFTVLTILFFLCFWVLCVFWISELLCLGLERVVSFDTWKSG